MRIRTLGILGCALLALVGCGRLAESRLNPMGWFDGPSKPETLAPKEGYPTAKTDSRTPLAQITGARWEPLYEGRMLVVTGLANSKGWWHAALVTEQPMPPGRLAPDQNGVLRLRLLGNPPPADSPEARQPASPASDTISVALTISNENLADIREVVISGAANSVSLRP
ncbi:MAG: hypothetical protein QM682_07920 [Paracoccus sp. (in: a-proteobacteria)]|uniref:hypothetical protein n=1 Tax=Paracoccus sp. TaxID=267 RepID=UPI0039E5B756